MFDGVGVRTAGLSLRGERGWVYRDVGIEAGPGSLTAVAGQAGSGRTSLLLSLAGRMRPGSGTLAVGRYTTPRAIRRIAALGLFDGVNDLDGALSVREHVRERGPRLPRGRGRREWAADALALAGLEPDPLDRTLVRDLGRERRVRLGIALALLDRPGLLVLDDVDTGLAVDRREELWATLRDLAERGLTVVASCTESDLPLVVRLPCPDVTAVADARSGPGGDPQVTKDRKDEPPTVSGGDPKDGEEER
ncbi:ATP-binding cassette domain-containing protein [Streptosporangium amethystogenes]|uniref:ATP-binding cassette domain-containing protein n=1 Tax=Streptosporangium amethystogenes TaxID=2002 RepID=UPI00068B3BB5|nr:ATP-binding cassette domain-containing protein [Streptosporangium amethystogenes]